MDEYMSGSQIPEEMAHAALSDNEVRELFETRRLAGSEHVQTSVRSEAGVTRIRTFERDILLTELCITLPYPWPAWYAVQAAANRLAASGAIATHFSAHYLLPEQEQVPARESVREACSAFFIKLYQLNITRLAMLSHPILLVHLLGEQSQDNEASFADARPGDQIIQLGTLGLETAALLTAKYAEPLAQDYDKGFVWRCRDFIRFPGLSALRTLSLCREHDAVRGLVVVGERGILGAARELSALLDCGSEIHEDAVVLEPEAKLLCEHFGLDPLQIRSEGVVLAVVAREGKEEFLQMMQEKKIAASTLGELDDKTDHRLNKGLYSIRLPSVNQKPLLKLLE